MRSPPRFGTAILGAFILPASSGLPASAGDAVPVEITAVDLSQTYPWDPAKDFEKPFPPEIAAEAASVTWRLGVDLEDGAIDLGGALGNPTNVVVYCRVILEASAPTGLMLALGSDDGLTVFVNGTKIHAVNRMRGMKPGEDRAGADLVKGRNVLLFRVTQGTGGFGLHVAARAAGPATVAQVIQMPPAKVKIPFTLDAEALTSAGIYDAQGRLVRQAWRMRTYPAGRHEGGWDGLDEFGREAPPGEYAFKVVANRSTYRNVGVIGNNAVPNTEKNHYAGGLLSIATDAAGDIYTANGWEEAGQDFRKWSKEDGRHRFDAEFQIRNGNPNGAPHAIAVDDTHIYCCTHGWAGEQWKSKMQIQRFRIADGKHETFSGIREHAGHIQLYEWPERQVPAGTPEADAALMRLPLRAIAVRGDALVVTDALGGKVHRFHKVTGRPLGPFPVKLPHALAIGPRGRLWVGHEHGKVTVFGPDGKDAKPVLADLGEIRALAFGPDGRLYAADAKTGQVKIHDVDLDARTASLQRTFGRKAVPGDHAPDRYYELRALAVDRAGNLVTSQAVPTGGARLARFDPAGKCLWECQSLEFCSTGNYGAHRPDELISQYFNRYVLEKQAGTWAYRGTVLASDPKYINWQHGATRLLKLGDREFFLQAYGDGMQAYRREGDAFTLAAMLGGCNPRPDGVYNDRLPGDQRKPPGQWSWSDANGNGRVDDAEVQWFKRPGEARFVTFGMNADARGNLVYGEHHTHAIWEIPMTGLDPKGNPVWDWAKAAMIVPPDTSPVQFEQPLMAVRGDDGALYAFGRSKAWPSPPCPAWMAGWALLKYDADNKPVWAARLPKTCPGMDVIPGTGGVMIGWYEKGVIYHYTADGLLIGSMRPGEVAGKITGWLDNTSAVSVNRDPRDGLLDVFVEDSYLHRFLWYRVQDRGRIETIEGQCTLKG